MYFLLCVNPISHKKNRRFCICGFLVLIIKFGFQFLPKKTNFDLIYQHQIDIIQNKINNRPMKVLNWNTPRCVFFSS